MLSLIGKKKLSHQQLANIFVNSILDVVENGFKEVAELINEDVSFEKRPHLSTSAYEHFLLIVIVGNLKYISSHFDTDQVGAIEDSIREKFSSVFGITENEFNSLIKDYESFISRVNHPSKNTLYGMSKAVFHKYELHQYQQDHFKNLKTPNPIFLKRLDEVMQNFLWDWEAFSKKYKLNF